MNQNENARPISPPTFEALINGIDQGIEAHLAWNQKLLRCSLLHESPGNDMLSPRAHELCRFGLWFLQVRPELDRFDAKLTQSIANAHQSMHSAVAAMCAKVLNAAPALPDELSVYEQNQTAMVTLLNSLRQNIADAAIKNDVLTGLPLRHGMEHAFELRTKDANRKKQSLWLAMIDVDKFKSVNDTHGHVVGDLALRHIAATLSASLRENDVLIRFGGEEFVGLFLISECESVTSVMQRLLDALHAEPLRTDAGLVLKLTATVGVARVRQSESLTSAIDRADHALLQGKTFGRDQYVLAPD